MKHLSSFFLLLATLLSTQAYALPQVGDVENYLLTDKEKPDQPYEVKKEYLSYDSKNETFNIRITITGLNDFFHSFNEIEYMSEYLKIESEFNRCSNPLIPVSVPAGVFQSCFLSTDNSDKVYLSNLVPSYVVKTTSDSYEFILISFIRK